jgi:hypothetical protein
MKKSKLKNKEKYGADLIDELCEKPAFEKAVDDFRHKWKIDVSNEIHFLVEDYKPDLMRKGVLLKNKKFIADVRKLQGQFNLDERWSSFIEEYIFIDIFADKSINRFLLEKRAGKNSDAATGQPAYYLRIFPETTKEDVEEAWGRINKFIYGTKIKIKRNKQSKKHKRDREIYKLARLGFSVNQIQKYIDEKYHNYLQQETIIIAESRYRKKMGIKSSNKLHFTRGESAPLTDMQKLVADFPDF